MSSEYIAQATDYRITLSAIDGKYAVERRNYDGRWHRQGRLLSRTEVDALIETRHNVHADTEYSYWRGITNG